MSESELLVVKLMLVVILPYFAGYALRKLNVLNDKHSKIGIMVYVLCFMPAVSFFAIWGIQIGKKLKYLPLAGFIVTFTIFLISIGISYALKLDNEKKGSFVFSNSLSNLGVTLGGIICFYFYGKEGYGKSVIYIIYFNFMLYFFCFPFAQVLTGKKGLGFLHRLKEFFTDIRTLPLYTSLIALVLTFAGVESPRWSPQLLKILMPIASIMGVLWVGVSLRFSRIKNYLKLYPLVFFIKFILTPLVSLAVIWVFGFTGLDRNVVLLLSFMPSALFAIYLSSFFDLDIDLANSMYVVTTLGFFVIVLPLLLVFM